MRIPRLLWVGLLLMVSGMLFSGCMAPTLIPLPSPTFQVGVTLQPSTTPLPKTSTPSPAVLTRVTLTLEPTATPFTYTVVEGDTLLGIAYRYSITLEELMAANPGVEPRLLSVGSVLIIPIAGVIQTSAPTTTPFPLDVDAPMCYPSAGGGAWCVMQLTNEQPGSLENISGWIELLGAEGQSLGGQTVYAPLNLLPSGKTISLQAFFAPPLPEIYSTQGSILTALPAPPEDARYIQASVAVEKIEIAASKREAQVRGQVTFPAEGPPPGVVWVVALAYGEGERVIGMRKWEQSQPCPSVEEQAQETACGPLPFEMVVYSLGPGIQRVEVLVEARPLDD